MKNAETNTICTQTGEMGESKEPINIVLDRQVISPTYQNWVDSQQDFVQQRDCREEVHEFDPEGSGNYDYNQGIEILYSQPTPLPTIPIHSPEPNLHTAHEHDTINQTEPSFSYSPSNYEMSGGISKFYRELYKKQISERLYSGSESEPNDPDHKRSKDPLQSDDDDKFLSQIIEEEK